MSEFVVGANVHFCPPSLTLFSKTIVKEGGKGVHSSTKGSNLAPFPRPVRIGDQIPPSLFCRRSCWKKMEGEESSSCCSYSSIPPNDQNPCPICLGPVREEAYLDHCFHKFCYNCIARWAKVVAGQSSQPDSSLKCPFCKRDNFSIVYGCNGDTFQRHYINKDPENSNFFSKSHKYRLETYFCEAGAVCDKFDIQRYWKSRRYLQPNKWFQIWLRREIQALTQEEDVDIIVYHILGVVDYFLRQTDRKYSKRGAEETREEFKALISDAARPFLIGRTERFVKEVELFLASGLNVSAYDKVYLESMGSSTSNVTNNGDEETEHTPIRASHLHLFAADSDTE